MKKRIRLSLVALLLAGFSAGAQDKVETAVGADFVSQYIWRGQDMGSLAVQPTLGVSYKGVGLSAWGSFGLGNPADTRELDLKLSYTVGGFNIAVTDYWFSTGLDPQGRYFAYAPGGTNHVFEANIGYDFGFASLQWYTNFAGNDSVDDAGNLSYSSYLEANVPFALGGADWTATAGVVPFATAFYGAGGFALVNLSLTASKEIRITDGFSVPVFAQLAANPCSNALYLILGVRLQP